MLLNSATRGPFVTILSQYAFVKTFIFFSLRLKNDFLLKFGMLPTTKRVHGDCATGSWVSIGGWRYRGEVHRKFHP